MTAPAQTPPTPQETPEATSRSGSIFFYSTSPDKFASELAEIRKLSLLAGLSGDAVDRDVYRRCRIRCQPKIEMSPFLQDRDVPFLWKVSQPERGRLGRTAR